MIQYGQHQFPGKLFVVEGTDGSGKSTQLALLHQWLKAEGYPVFFSEWNSSPLVKDTTKRAKKRHLFTPTTFSLIHATLDVAIDRITSARPQLKYYEAGLDMGWTDDAEESFKIFQGKILAEYDRMVDEFGLTKIDATRAIERQQREVRRIIKQHLAEEA